MSERYQANPTALETYLEREMKNRNMSVVALARAAGIGRQTLHSYLNGERPTIENCRKLAFFLGVPLGTIVSMAYPDDVEGKLIDSLVSLYISLPDEGRHLAEEMMFSLQRHLGERGG